ncbi:YfbM family protein [Cytobacillus suaedae]|nr:YfbM family protein [Cytobacillus suaedae]
MMGMIATFFRVPNTLLNLIKAEPDHIEELVLDSDEVQETALDIDKSWHGIYFLLSGEPDLEKPITSLVGEAILGGTEVGEDFGYGPMRYHEPTDVQNLYHELQKVSLTDLSNRFDIKKFSENNIYPMYRKWSLEDKDYLLENYEFLVAFYKKAAEEKEAILVVIE